YLSDVVQCGGDLQIGQLLLIEPVLAADAYGQLCHAPAMVAEDLAMHRRQPGQEIRSAAEVAGDLVVQLGDLPRPLEDLLLELRVELRQSLIQVLKLDVLFRREGVEASVLLG